jgi:hypothetical protein
MHRRAGFLALINLALLVILNGKPEFTSSSRVVRGITSPVLALELARNVDEVDLILEEKPSLDREVMRVKQYWDFVFIAAYWMLYVTIARLLEQRKLAVTAAIAATVAAVCDVIENVAILRVVDADLAHTTQGMIDAIRIPSLIKWSLVFTATGILATYFWPRIKTLAAIWWLAPAIGFYGLADNAVLIWAGLPILAGLIGIALLFLWPARRRLESKT